MAINRRDFITTSGMGFVGLFVPSYSSAQETTLCQENTLDLSELGDLTKKIARYVIETTEGEGIVHVPYFQPSLLPIPSMREESSPSSSYDEATVFLNAGIDDGNFTARIYAKYTDRDNVEATNDPGNVLDILDFTLKSTDTRSTTKSTFIVDLDGRVKSGMTYTCDNELVHVGVYGPFSENKPFAVQDGLEPVLIAIEKFYKTFETIPPPQ